MIIDIHGHITPPELLARLPMPPALGDIEGMIEQKAGAGIGLSIVGSPVGVGTMVPVAGLDNFEQPADGLQRFHDWLAETVAAHRDRLRAYAWTNPFGDEALLEQTVATVKEGGFVGLMVNTSVRGEYLDSPRADDFFAMASELDVPILLHPPAEPVGSTSFGDLRLVEQVGRVSDVTASLATLAFSDRLQAFPNLKIIGAMAGGAISLLPGRLDTARRSPAPGPGGRPPAALAPETMGDPSSIVRRFYVDTATFSVENLAANLTVLGADRLLFGSDFPPASRPLEDSIALIEQLGLTDEDRERVHWGNARALFKLDDVPIPTTLDATHESGGS